MSYELAAPNIEAFFSDRDGCAIPGFGALATVPLSDSGLSLQSADGVTGIVIERGHVDIRSATLTHNGTNISQDHTHPGIAPGPANTGGPE